MLLHLYGAARVYGVRQTSTPRYIATCAYCTAACTYYSLGASGMACARLLRERVVPRVQRYFVDLRVITFVMVLWIVIVVGVFVDISASAEERSPFFSVGPRPTLTFMHLAIDTHYKYNVLIFLVFMHTLVTDVIADSLTPHVLNVVQDRSNRYIPHKANTYLLVTTTWAIYCSISQLFSIFIAFAQIDLLLVRLLSDIMANAFTTHMYLHNKVHDPAKYLETTQRLAPHHPHADERQRLHDNNDSDSIDGIEMMTPRRNLCCWRLPDRRAAESAEFAPNGALTSEFELPPHPTPRGYEDVYDGSEDEPPRRTTARVKLPLPDESVAQTAV